MNGSGGSTTFDEAPLVETASTAGLAVPIVAGVGAGATSGACGARVAGPVEPWMPAERSFGV